MNEVDPSVLILTWSRWANTGLKYVFLSGKYMNKKARYSDIQTPNNNKETLLKRQSRQTQTYTQ